MEPNKNNILYLFQKCYYVKEILEELSFSYNTPSYKKLERYINQFGIDDEYNIFKIKSKKLRAEQMKNVAKLESKGIETLVENSETPRITIKRIILREKLIEYKCNECTLSSLWNDKRLTLHLDHINGINNDHRLENLRFLCPNCHSQTKTFSGRNISNKG